MITYLCLVCPTNNGPQIGECFLEDRKNKSLTWTFMVTERMQCRVVIHYKPDITEELGTTNCVVFP